MNGSHTPPAPARDARVPLAMERTFLAWIRTALAMMGFGVVVARFGLFLREMEIAGGTHPPRTHGISPYLGTALVALGVCAAAWAIVRYRRSLASFERGEWPLSRSATVPTLMAVALCGVGIAAIVYFLVIA